MRLNLDCVRDILLCVEENSGLYKSCTFIDFGPPGLEEFHDKNVHVPPYQLDLSKKYSNEELIYHVKYCSEAELFSDARYIDNDILCVDDLSPNGHEFIANIRSDSVWNKAKSAAAKIGVSSIPALLELASKIAMTLTGSWIP